MSSTTATLSAVMKTYYDRLFLATAKHWLVMEEGAQVRPLPKNEGKVIYFTLWTPLALVTTALSEGTNPTAVDLSATNVSATVAEYGSYTPISKLVSLTAIDPKLESAVKVMAQNAGETRDSLVAAVLSGGTAQLADGTGNITGLAVTNTFDAGEVRKAVRTLKDAKAMRYPDGYFIGKTSPYCSYDLQGDTTWVNASVYNGAERIYNGELGKLHGVRFLESTNPVITASTVSVYHNFIHGSEAFGVTDLSGDEQRVYVKVPDAGTVSVPTDRYSTMGWNMTFVPKLLRATWVMNVKCGATA